MLTNSNLFITDSTGLFGHSFVQMALEKYNPKRLVILSRNKMKKFYSDKLLLRFFIGDVRYIDNLFNVLDWIDYVVYAGVTKIVPTAEYNPFECIKKNISVTSEYYEKFLTLKESNICKKERQLMGIACITPGAI